MPQAGVPARAPRRHAAPWWEELDREAFRFPAVATERTATLRPAPAQQPAPARRTVTIRGHGAERNLPVARPALRRHERPGFRPDRAALWAVILGLVLILVAVASAHG
jgi:hypothetical protein